MKKIVHCCLLTLSLPAFSQNKRIEAETAIRQVTIFTSGAQVVRTASVNVPAGRYEIVFSGLSNQLEQQSIQLKADADLTLLSVQSVKDFLGQRKIDDDEKDLLDKIDNISSRNEADVNELLVYKSEAQMLEKNESIGGQTGVKAEDLKQALDLHRQRLLEVYRMQAELNRRLKEEQAQISTLKAQLQQISRKKDSVNFTVVALVSARQTRNVKFELQYTIKDAGWYPSYDARIGETGEPLELLMNANVFQRSGETWKDIDLLFSTGNPRANITPGSLQPWMVGFNDPSLSWVNSHPIQPGTVAGRVVNEKGEPLAGATIEVRGGRVTSVTDENGFFKIQSVPYNSTLVISSVGFSSRQFAAKPGYYSITLPTSVSAMQEVVVVGYSSSGLERSEDAAAPAAAKRKSEPADISIVGVSTQFEPTTTIYKVDQKYTLETNGRTVTIGIRKTKIPALFKYYAAPKLEAASYLTASILNWQDYELLPGEASLYFQGTYLGKTYLDLSGAVDTLSLALGKDNGVITARRVVGQYISRRFLGSNRLDTRDYEIIVKNTKTIAVNILVEDQFPVTTNKDIVVEDAKAPEAQVDKQTGIVRWNLDLQPGATAKLRLSYTVKYPKDRKINL